MLFVPFGEFLALSHAPGQIVYGQIRTDALKNTENSRQRQAVGMRQIGIDLVASVLDGLSDTRGIQLALIVTGQGVKLIADAIL